MGIDVGRITMEEARKTRVKSENERVKYISTYEGHTHIIETAIKKNLGTCCRMMKNMVNCSNKNHCLYIRRENNR